MRSMNSSERIEEMICELEGYRWDAVLLNETWRLAKSEIWDKHVVGILLNKKWRQRIIDTEYINERATTTMNMVNHQRIKLMSAYFLTRDMPIITSKKMYKKLRNTRNPKRRSYRLWEVTSTLNWGPGVV